MKVIREGYVLYNTERHNYLCMQNTQTPKVYASKKKAEDGAAYHSQYDANAPDFKIEKVFLVAGEDYDNQAI